MVSFYPGPSRIYDGVPRWTAEAARKGILSMNHRSPEFMDLVEKTNRLLRARLHIPKTYAIFFVSSATECWEIIAQSLVHNHSLHLHNGSFGEKWYHYTKRLKPQATDEPFDPDTIPDLDRLNPSADAVICLTHNETSNGTCIPTGFLRDLRKRFPSQVIAVDATSSMAGVNLDFKAGDVWFASVQKCFGLPAGLALLICSPRALERARSLGERLHYNSIVFLETMMALRQTTHTPNILGIYLLCRSLEKTGPIASTEKKIAQRARAWYEFLGMRHGLRPLVPNSAVQSKTVIAVAADPGQISTIKRVARQAGFLLGNGYAPWATTSFRIANFPALTNKEINGLLRVMKAF